MDPHDIIEDVPPLAHSGRRLVRRLLTIGENRLELLIVELQEERIRLERALMFTGMMILFALLAGIAFTFFIAAIFWETHRVLALGILFALYAAGGGFFYARLARLRQDWQTLPATLEQLKKDRACLEKHLA